MRKDQKKNLLILLLFCLCVLALLWMIWRFYEIRIEKIDHEMQSVQLTGLYLVGLLLIGNR